MWCFSYSLYSGFFQDTVRRSQNMILNWSWKWVGTFGVCFIWLWWGISSKQKAEISNILKLKSTLALMGQIPIIPICCLDVTIHNISTFANRNFLPNSPFAVSPAPGGHLYRDGLGSPAAWTSLRLSPVTGHGNTKPTRRFCYQWVGQNVENAASFFFNYSNRSNCFRFMNAFSLT